MVSPVTDPLLLQQLEAGDQAASSGPQAVTDPLLLQQLESPDPVPGTGRPHPQSAGYAPGTWGHAAQWAGGNLLDLGHNLATGAVRSAAPMLDAVSVQDSPFVPTHHMRSPGGEFEDAAWNVMPPYQPKTMAGRVTQAAGGGLLSAPYGVPATLLGMFGGSTGQLGSELSGGNPYVTAAAGTLPMLIPGGYLAARSSLGNAVLQGTEHMTPEMWSEAIRRQNLSRDIGAPLLASEAIDAPALHRFTSDATASKAGGATIQNFLTDRPGQVRDVVNNDILDPISAQPITTNATAAKVQGAAEGAIQAAERDRSAQTKPFYQAAAADTVPQGQVQSIVNQIDRAIAADPGNLNPQLRAMRDSLVNPDGSLVTNVNQLDRARKIFRDRTELPPTAASAMEKTTASELPLGDLRDTLTRASPDFAQGRALHEEISNNVVSPLQRSDIGTLADRAGIPENRGIQSQINTIANPDTARPAQISQVAGHLNLVDRTAFPELARTYFENAFNGAQKGPRAAPDNPASGIAFSQRVNGSPQQKLNNQAILEGVAQSHGIPLGGLKAGFDNAMEVFDRMGRVPGTGSPTAERLATNADLGSGPGTSLMGLQLDKPFSMIGLSAEKLRGMYMARAYRQFAAAITSPEGVQKLRQLSMLNPQSARAQIVVGELAGLNAQRSHDQQQ